MLRGKELSKHAWFKKPIRCLVLTCGHLYLVLAQWTTLTTRNNTICWFVAEYLDKYSNISAESRQNAGGWGPGAAAAMCDDVRHLKVPIRHEGKSLTVGDLIDMSPKDSISKVMMEEKVLDTWHGGRCVLLGDGMG